jgi:hypothetical protein
MCAVASQQQQPQCNTDCNLHSDCQFPQVTMCAVSSQPQPQCNTACNLHSDCQFPQVTMCAVSSQPQPQCNTDCNLHSDCQFPPGDDGCCIVTTTTAAMFRCGTELGYNATVQSCRLSLAFCRNVPSQSSSFEEATIPSQTPL